MNTDFGFAEIYYKEKVFQLKPTFINISKLGSPKQIIKMFEDLFYKPFHVIKSFGVALDIIRACGLDDDDVTGYITISPFSNKSMICKGAMNIDEVFILADHCLKHGVCGMIEKDDDNKDQTGNPMVEFDAFQYITIAMEFLGISINEAENLTMTQFLKLVRAKNKTAEMRKNGGQQVVTVKEAENDALQEYYRQEAKLKAAREKKLKEKEAK